MFRRTAIEVADFANTLASSNGGIAPTVVNFAIDGETAASFMSGAGRTPPVMGRTDAILAAQNLNYANSPTTSQADMLRSLVASEAAAGNTINTISITLGFNELGALATMPASQAVTMLPQTLATYQANYTAVLTTIRALDPGAKLYLVGYYNPFPANPGNPAGPIFAQGGPQVNAIVQNLASEFNAYYVNTNSAFLGNEAALTYISQYPAGATSPGTTYTGIEPIGDVHPNAAGYAVIANQFSSASTPEPASAGLVGIAAIGLGLMWKLRRNQA
jgi:lysophospholipase L1-like esterase